MLVKIIKPWLLKTNNNYTLNRYQLRIRFLMTSSRCLVRHKTDAVDEQFPSYSDASSVINKEGDDSCGWLNKLLYSSFLEKYSYRQDYRQRLAERKNAQLIEAQKALKEKMKASSVIALKYFEETAINEEPPERTPQEQMIIDEINEQNYTGGVQFPYQIYTKYSKVEEEATTTTDTKEQINEHESNRVKSDNLNMSAEELEKQLDKEDEEEESKKSSWIHTYGTPNPSIPASNVPCGGCGAFLHCQETAVPGYIPSESYKVLSEQELQTQICQRCYFLKVHDAALSVNVSPQSYPEILRHIEDKKALVILVVDLTDFPCSIWPGIHKIIGEKRPVILVGNKVDLIPRDSKKYLTRIKDSLKATAQDVGLDKLKIIGTHLISASTGYGVEGLITAVHDLWGRKGDIYIMGCTNVGKSTLFNVFIQSDLCKIQAVDLVQRATVSPWPGTTLNLLKFPVLHPDGWQLSLRYERLENWKASEKEEAQLKEFQLKQTHNAAYASLLGHVGRTYTPIKVADEAEFLNTKVDLFRVNANSVGLPKLTQLGQLNPDNPAFSHGKWCYDTPGTVNKNQILDKLLLPELMRILPKKLIRPRSYYLQLGTTMFIGGLARIDNSGNKPFTCTVFTSEYIPITIVHTNDAEELYKKALGTPIFGVPLGDEKRLAQFPPLKPINYEVEGTGTKFSCCDLVLSATGWVAITGEHGQLCKMTAFTPNGAGIFCRQPALLPYAVNLKGKRIRGTFAYNAHRLFIPKEGSRY